MSRPTITRAQIGALRELAENARTAYAYGETSPDNRDDEAWNRAVDAVAAFQRECTPDAVLAALDALTAEHEASARDAGLTRVEVIDHRSGVSPFGRVFSAWDCQVELSRQDGGRTLKVFVDDAARAATREEGR